MKRESFAAWLGMVELELTIYYPQLLLAAKTCYAGCAAPTNYFELARWILGATSKGIGMPTFETFVRQRNK